MNFIFLGDSDETLSARVARAKMAGVAWAIKACDILTTGQKLATFGKLKINHCQYALDKSIKTNSREILNLSTWPPSLRTQPLNEVMPEELNAN